jgi:hypothetical protein
MLIMELEWRMFSPKLALKPTLPICVVQTGMPTNYDDKTNVRDRSHVNYDGINVYGDEVTTHKKELLQAIACGAILSLNLQL